MISFKTLRFRGLAGLALFAAISAQPLLAQDAASGKAPTVVPPAAADESDGALETAARNIIALLETHRMRITRIDKALGNFTRQGDENRIRQYKLLREREQEAYQKTLETYRRLLGEEDFGRVTGLLRDYFARSQGATSESTASTRSPAFDPAAATARANRARRMAAAQATETRARAEKQAAIQRSQAIARVRSSQRQQLAQRLESSRKTAIAQREAVARRYQPPTPRGSNSRGTNSRGSNSRGSASGARGTTGRGATPTRGSTRGQP